MTNLSPRLLTPALTFTSIMLNIKVTHLDILQWAPIKTTAKYVTELIKLRPLQLGKKKRKKSCSTSFLMHVSHCEIILQLRLCNLVRGSWCDPPSENVRGIKMWLSKSPPIFFKGVLIKHGSYAKQLLLVEVQPGGGPAFVFRRLVVVSDSSLRGVFTRTCLSLRLDLDVSPASNESC